MKLVVLEGIDGVGKSTQSKLLYKRLKNEGFVTKLYSFPSKSEIGYFTRKLLDTGKFKELLPEAKLLLIGADIYNLMLSENEYDGILIIDRYWYSGLASQIPENIKEDWISNIFKYLPVPDIIFYLDCDPEDIIQRKNIDYYAEDLAYQKEKRKVYLNLEKRLQNFIIIDASRTKKEIHEKIYENIKSL